MELTLSQVLELAGYEAKITITRTSGTGTVSVGCPDGVEINDTDPSYVFSGQTSFFSTDCANARLASAIFATVDVPVSPRYLGTYTLDVSLDASVGSTFEISLSALPDDTFIRSGFEAPIPFNIGAPCELTVVACAVYGDVKPPLDGAVTIDDILCVLNGFGNFSTCPLGDIAPCFGNGIINLDDILAVLSAFAGNDPCCGGGGGAGSPGGPAPIITPHIGTRPTKAGRQTGNERNAGTELQLVPRAEKVASGDTVVVDVFAESVTDLRGYELRVETRADREGLVSLVGASVDEKHPDFAFAGRTSFPAIDVAGGRLACAAMEGAVSSRGRTYLGSFTFQTGAVKGGTFSVGLSSAQGAELRDSQSAPLGVVWPPVAVITVAN